MNYDNTNRGAIWRNNERTKETHPHYQGSINIDGKEYWLNAWKKEADASEKSPVLKFTVRPKEPVHQAGIDQAHKALAPDSKPFVDDFEDSDIPF